MAETHPPRFRFADLWRWHGTIGRTTYLALGVFLFLVKYVLDFSLSRYVFDRPWSPAAYLHLPGIEALSRLSDRSALYAAVLVAQSLPFIWMGTALTVKRLRAAALPEWLVVLFFVPLVNLLFFAVLCGLPSRGHHREITPPPKSVLDRLIPRDRFGSAFAAVVLTVPAFLLGAAVSAEVFATYGWGLFVGIPFALGLVAAMLYGYHEERSRTACVAVANLALTLLAVGLMIFAVEGAICLVMAAPLGYLLATLGGFVGYALQKRPGAVRSAPAVMMAVWLVIPLVLGVEGLHEPVPPLVAVRTTLDIDAPPEAVWENVVAFSTLPPPEDWLFKTGIAYPHRARIDGTGVGAVRYCEFTTGTFVEPITVWDAPRRLAFDVRAQPHPMQEWTFFEDMDPAHLDGYFGSERGQFLLTPLPGGRTRLEGTTWYRHRIWPNAYWRLWSDWIMHRIHRRVLRHVARLSEGVSLEAPP